MAHINFYLDLCVDTYVVNDGAVLLRLHEKYNYWGAPGGHIVLGVSALVCSRVLWWFFDDPEGPNLLVVIGLALVLYSISLLAYRVRYAMTNQVRILLAVALQVGSAIVLYYLLS